ncbi:MAG: FAD-binding oxidoreductase [Bacteroidetes bacterium 46-16]|nr:MAG: FAD-binding oxidoreductase [Bacteroidetes bacterium 46-16]
MQADTAQHDGSFDNIHETAQSHGVSIPQLQAELSAAIRGEVCFDAGSRARYATDASNYRQIPIGIVIPKSEEDIMATISICRKYGAPLLSRGGGTSLAGQCCNVAIVMDMSKYYNSILDVDIQNRLVRVQPGIVLDNMRKPMEKQFGLTFGPDPATHDHCTIGGMLGNNSCGVHSVMAQFRGYGSRTSDNVESLTVATYDGLQLTLGPTTEEELEGIIAAGGRKAEIYAKLKALRDKYADLIREKFPDIPRRVSGYDLTQLLPENGFNLAHALVGSEGTCVTILDATLRLIPAPRARSLVVLGYPDVYTAADHVMQILDFKPIGLEGMDDILIEYMKKKGLNINDLSLLPEGNGWLLVEFGADTKQEADEQAKAMMAALKKEDDAPNMSLFDDPEQEQMMWEVRESGLGATAFVPGEPVSFPGWEDSAVAPQNVGKYLKELRQLFDNYGYKPSVYGHFGQGCIHCRVQFDMFTKEGLEKYKAFTHEAAKLVVRYGGSLSGEHGDGQSRADLLEIMCGKELVQAFREFKAIWDPQGKMNPGKIVDAYGQLSNLRISNHYAPPVLKTHFSFGNEKSDFAHAALHCVGVGKCRRQEGGTMCPSYMVTMEEEHSTRGRAHMLFEMLQGDVIKNGWKDKSVKESLDLCLSCKGCKSDCPVNVDMATYKAEFLSHYYKGRLKPPAAYAFGWIHWWAKLASLMPGIANFVMQGPVIRNIVKGIAGIAPQRRLPRFASQTFRSWFRERKNWLLSGERPQVILWTDTFNNNFKPETLVAGLDVLEAAGFEVLIPKTNLCCGRPLYDYGMLNTARRLLNDIMSSLKKEIHAGIPIVGLEPSCVAVFRDELTGLFPDSEEAKRLQEQTYTLTEFLQKYVPDLNLPKINKKAIVHGHCHHKAIMKMKTEQKLLDRTGLEYNMLDSGCCGMAGSFGYEKGNRYTVSVNAGERVLLPEVRKAEKDILIIADGFSCREQVEQQTQRRGLHTAQVLHMAMNGVHKKDTGENIENEYLDKMKLKPGKAAIISNVLAGVAIGMLSAYALLSVRNKK